MECDFLIVVSADLLLAAMAFKPAEPGLAPPRHREEDVSRILRAFVPLDVAVYAGLSLDPWGKKGLTTPLHVPQYKSGVPQ